MYIKAIHTIQRDPKANPPVVFPGKLADLEGAELAYVLRSDVRAAVEATEDDLVKAGIIQRPDPEKDAAEFAAIEAAEAAAKEQAEKDAAEAAAKEQAEKDAAEAAAKAAAEQAEKDAAEAAAKAAAEQAEKDAAEAAVKAKAKGKSKDDEALV